MRLRLLDRLTKGNAVKLTLSGTTVRIQPMRDITVERPTSLPIIV